MLSILKLIEIPTLCEIVNVISVSLTAFNSS